MYTQSLQSRPTLCDPMDCTCHAPLSMRLSRQEQWSGLPCPPPGALLNPGIESASPVSSAFQMDSLTIEPPGKPQETRYISNKQPNLTTEETRERRKKPKNKFSTRKNKI